MNDARRALLKAFAALAGAAAAGCDRISRSPEVARILEKAEPVNRVLQRMLGGRRSMAQEFTLQDLSPTFRSNGTSDPDTEEYDALAADGFAQWRLTVGGLVAQPLSLSLAELRALPSRTQITRHDCVEGWSAIGQWTGVPLARVLELARPAPGARFVVFHCADLMEGTEESRYYESIDMDDALHPQTLLAYELNGKPLPVPNGAPLRL
ncbi:MAG TPA: molybdopterin-dependent oxidoreductase, partial [Usitatibacter sp.]|nr:molybdopterin-dependent oxidoreductase [Usitatibacter sp.]